MTDTNKKPEFREWFVVIGSPPEALSDTAARSMEKLKLGRYAAHDDEIVRVIEHAALLASEERVREAIKIITEMERKAMHETNCSIGPSNDKCSCYLGRARQFLKASK